MKKILLLFVLISFLSCNDDQDSNSESNNTILGRWHLVGFEQTVMYDFKTDLRYSIYSSNGEFGETETSAIPNPNPWYIENQKIFIDLHFGNISSSELNFRNNGNVVDFINEEGSITTTLFREGYNYSSN
jgi:hypothetical protein